MVDSAKESIELECALSVELSQLEKHVPANQPRFLFFSSQDEFGFAYVCPPSFKVKERMLYSSSRAHIVSIAEDILGPIKNKVTARFFTGTNSPFTFSLNWMVPMS